MESGKDNDHGASWIADEFRRTRLPKGALAAYLGVDPAAVTRAAKNPNYWSDGQLADARAFFSVVPPKADAGYVDAVRRLRLPDVRARASTALGRWLTGHGIRPQASAHPLDACMLGVALRADQIVALAQVLAIPLPKLTRPGAAVPIIGSILPPAEDREGILVLLQDAVRKWASGGQSVYAIERGETADGTRGGQSRDIALTGADLIELTKVKFSRPSRAQHLYDELGLKTYLVLTHQLSPRFERGDVILAEQSHPRGEFSTGDWIIAEYPESHGTIVGRVLAASSDERLFLVSPAGTTLEVRRPRQWVTIRGIHFVD